MGWLIALGILVLLAILPLGVSVAYDSDGPLVKIIAGPVRLQVVPARKKSDQKEKKPKDSQSDKKIVKPGKNEKAKPESAASEKPAEKKQGGNLLDFLPLVDLALDFLGAFTRKLRVNRLELDLVLAGDDPCDLATNYGRAWSALGNLWPRLEEIFVIKKRQVEIQCDFEASRTLVTARLDISITLGRLLSLVVCYGIRALVQFIKITNKRKGGAAI